MKRTLSLLLSLLMIMNIISCVAITVSAASVSDLKFTLNNDGESYSVEARNQSLTGKLVIPSTFSGYPVTHINENAFKKCDDITSITIPDSVTTIGDSAFYYCTSLISITIPDSVTSIGDGAFNDCTSLTSITIPDSVTSIAPATFWGCTGLISINIPEGVASIGRRAFEYCTNLKSITIPKSVMSIGEDAFYLCYSLSSVYITDISAWCKIKFDGDTASPLGSGVNLYLNGKLATNIVIPDGITEISSYAFSHCSKLRTVVIPDSVKVIGDDAFSYCVSLTSVTLPDNVTKICYRAFVGCSNLTYILLHNKIQEIESKAFLDCYNLKGTYYTGTAEEWNNIDIDEVNDPIFYNVILDYNSRIPLPPVITGISNTTTGVKLTWDKVTGADSYRIYRQAGSGKWELLVKDITSTTYTDTSVTSGTIYKYKARSYSSEGLSDNHDNYKTIKFLSAPKVSMAANVVSGMKVQWNAVKGATKYYVYRRGAGGDFKHIKTVTTTSYVDTSISKNDGYVYWYTIKSGDGTYISSYYGETSPNVIKAKRLSAPRISSTKNVTSGIEITWNKIGGAKGYNVYRKTGSSDYKYIGKTASTKYIDTSVKNSVGKVYEYTVRATYDSFISSFYNENAPAIKRLITPSLISAVSGKSGITLKWSKVTGAQGYIIYRKTGSGSYTKLKTEKGVSNLSYVDKSAKKGKKYTYKVKAYYGKTYSAYSNTKTIKDKY